jgi:hypothetical protein
MNKTINNEEVIELASRLVNIIKELNDNRFSNTAGVYLNELSDLLKTRSI